MKINVGLTVAAMLPVMAAVDVPEIHAIWKEFKANLRAGSITNDDLRPYYPQLREPMLRFLESFRRNSRPEDWEAKPELHLVGNQIHGIISLTGADGKKVPYCFTLLVENSTWYFQHVESIFIRLDQIGTLPASRFPDVTEAQKAWMRDERRVTEQIKVYNLLAKEKGRDFALRLFQDGAGYALEARTWVPFVSPSKAFILFLCWEQANLFGNPVTLHSMDDTSAVVLLQPRWFKLYRQTAHLRQLIEEAEFRDIFETMWQDRARAAGWKLKIEHRENGSVLRSSADPSQMLRSVALPNQTSGERSRSAVRRIVWQCRLRNSFRKVARSRRRSAAINGVVFAKHLESPVHAIWAAVPHELATSI